MVQRTCLTALQQNKMMIDTHTHLYLPEFEEEKKGEDAVRRAINVGVTKMIFPNVDLSTLEPMRNLAAKFPETIKCAIGLHPTEINERWEEILNGILAQYDPARDVAIGEIGMDLYWDKTFAEEQMKAFDAQCLRARELNLPIIIHQRDGLDEALEVLKNHPGIRGVFHSFGGTREDVERIRRVGDFYFGINGIVTFKNSKLRETLSEIGLERILLETDSPYLAPVPHRGKRNESQYLPLIAAHIAQTLGVTNERVAETTTQNAETLFNL